jgi:hypothetical protein
MSTRNPPASLSPIVSRQPCASAAARATARIEAGTPLNGRVGGLDDALAAGRVDARAVVGHEKARLRLADGDVDVGWAVDDGVLQQALEQFAEMSVSGRYLADALDGQRRFGSVEFLPARLDERLGVGGSGDSTC